MRPAQPLETERLTLEPLRVEHAEEMAGALDDVALHRFTGGEPATPAALRARYRRLAAGRSPDGSQGWLNWVLRRRDTGAVAGTVQATTYRTEAGLVADVAWVVATPQQGQGFATEAALAMAGWLREQGVRTLVAHVHPDHDASIGVARRLGLRATDERVDGEVCWRSG